MTPVIVMWYLIIANPNGGLLAIPQIDRPTCIEQAQHLNAYFRDLTSGTDLFCVYGKPETTLATPPPPPVQTPAPKKDPDLSFGDN